MKKRILCFGDSNTWGYAVTGGRFCDDVRWPTRLQALLGENVTVIEEGFNGRTCVYDDPIEASGFLGEHVCFFDALLAGQTPPHSVEGSLQSLLLATCVKNRMESYDISRTAVPQAGQNRSSGSSCLPQ
jgi:hypothetical protein